jgi:alanine-alpha-ketoisovalerate/valine-pyruvate aminotransferase
MIREKTIPHDIVIDLDGPDGNAFVLLGTAKRFARQLCYDKTETDLMLADMRSSDYEHLLEVFDKHFGDFVILERSIVE